MSTALPHPDMPASSQADDQLDLRDLLYAVWGGRWIVGGVVAFSMLGGLAYSMVATPLFRADALVQVERKPTSVTGSSDDLYELMAGRDSISTEIELLKSRMVIGRVVDDLKLHTEARPRRFPLVGRAIARGHREAGLADPPPGLSRYAWGGERIELGDFTLPEGALNERFRLTAGDAGSYRLESRVLAAPADGKVGEPLEFMTDSGAGRLFVRDLAARPGTEFDLTAHRRLDVIQKLARSLQVVERGRMSGILAISLEHPSPEMAATIVNAIANAYQRQNVERRSAEAEQTLAFVNEQLPIVRGDLEAAENELNRYRLAQKSADLTKETEIVLQQTVSLEQRRLELQQKREESLRRFTASHPMIQGLDAQLAQIGSEQRSIADRIKGLPQTQQTLLRLSRDIEVNNALYTALLNSAEQLRITRAGTVGNVRIVDFALQPFRPVRPSRGLIMTLSVVAGLFAGLVAIGLRRTLFPGVSDPMALERALKLQTYAVVPFAPAQKKIAKQIQSGIPVSAVLAVTDPASPAVEAIRSLRTALLVEARDSRKVVMVCGPSPGVGKSFVSANLAASIAMTGRKVALVDADIRRGHLHLYMAKGARPGLADFIPGRCTLEEMLHPTTQENLFLVPTGTIPEHPAEMLQSPRFEEAIRWLSGRFDYVIMDSAPVLAVTDAIIVGRVVDTTVLVLGSGKQSLREIDDTVKRLRRGGTGVTGAVFNMVDRAEAGAYGASYGYYDYRYKSRRD